MYKLTLTIEERKAIDWVGGRYSHGTDLYKLIWHCETKPDFADWDTNCDITFTLPEHVMWRIEEIYKEDKFTCFGPELVVKLHAVIDAIV